MNDLQGLGSGEIDADARHAERQPQSFPTTIPKPVIAAINGPVAGIGLVQALMCDLRFAAAGAKFTTAFSRRGLIAEHGISWILPRLVGPAKAAELIMLGDPTPAPEALRIGLVNRVVPDAELAQAAAELAGRLATAAPRALGLAKRALNRSLEVGLEEALAYEAALQGIAGATADHGEGVAAFREKRAPHFTGE
jgi:2-(1,2-epoxy-1,2-dihydrophenyl)acetyl-CoA isomerase